MLLCLLSPSINFYFKAFLFFYWTWCSCSTSSKTVLILTYLCNFLNLSSFSLLWYSVLVNAKIYLLKSASLFSAKSSSSFCFFSSIMTFSNFILSSWMFIYFLMILFFVDLGSPMIARGSELSLVALLYFIQPGASV